MNQEAEYRASARVANTFFKGASDAFIRQFFPALAVAYERFLMERLRQKQIARAKAALMYPTVYMTQPVMQQMMLGAEDPYADLREGYPGE